MTVLRCASLRMYRHGRRRGRWLFLAAVLCACTPDEPALPALPSAPTEGFLPVVARQLTTLHDAAASAPDDAGAAATLGMAYMAYRRPEAAAPALERAHRLQPDEWQWPYLYALALSETDRFDEAVAVLERLAVREPGQPYVRTRLAQAYLETGQFEKARAELDAVLAEHPATHEAIYAMARLKLQTGAPAEARDLLQRLLDERGPSGALYATLAEAWRQLGDETQWARHHAQYERYRHIGYSSDDPAMARVASLDRSDKPLMQAARARLAMGKTDDAIRFLHAALERNPRSIAAHESLIDLYAQRNRFAEVDALYERALAIGPPPATLLRAVGQARLEQGNLEAARSVLESAIDLDSNDATTHTLLGLVSRRENRAALAARSFATALALNPAADTARLNLAELLLIESRHDEAIAHLEPLVSVESEIGLRAQIYLGEVLLLKGQTEAARARLEQAIALGTRLNNARAVATIRKTLADSYAEDRPAELD